MSRWGVGGVSFNMRSLPRRSHSSIDASNCGEPAGDMRVVPRYGTIMDGPQLVG
jgi:hypothetical protein